ncbi:hypothetical protein [Streptomyces yaizuensis]|uniref:Uncharacterized protein n=1 Tax=Streptomyces yaizuensis TaxID=2989713 RepID=A0ABQ5PBJ8_9ACTN|nr:hypothetical protein [Streptomyces sp. YSPA8]GLF99922.1 hypothetical protein SYYSPA8_36515 [Streptomyces sp. YSPA8]
MTVLIAEISAPLLASAPPLDVMEYERIVCGQCDRQSRFFDDGHDGHDEAQGAGWHVLDRDECGCSILCRDCADEWCGYRDTSPRLFGMRIV